MTQVLVGGGDDLYLHGFAQGRADRLDGAVFEEFQQLGLYVQRDLTDLVEEQGAARRRFDIALLAALQRAGKGAALVAEHLGFEQALRDAPAIDVDERTIAPTGGSMDVPGDRCLADPRLTQQQQPCAPAERAHAGVGDAR
ncbi:hypothetical protein D3C84_937260 [compost metagenome]